jgi:hypothetical protein
MPIYSNEFVRVLLDERVTIRETIDRLRAGTLCRAFTLPEREAAIASRLETEAEVSALIAEFSRYGNYPILCPHTDPDGASVIRVRFRSVSYRTEAAGRLSAAHEDRDDLRGHATSGSRADSGAMPGRRVKR